MKIINLKELKQQIESHRGMCELATFGANLQKRALTFDELKIFMATLWPFYRETPSGILDLALRISDFWKTIDPWEANAIAAHLLYADVDEFGLHDIHNKIYPTHHQLFKNTAKHFNISNEDLVSVNNILNAGVEMGKISYEYYRIKSIPLGLGFHLSSELTSLAEFTYFLNGIISHKHSYNVESENDESMTLFRVHTIVEQMHLDHSEQIINAFCRVVPEAFEEIQSGAEMYMTSYQKLFKSLNSGIFYK